MRRSFSHPTSIVDYKVFDNQLQFGKDIAHSFFDRTLLHVLAVALTQSGKTGSMLSLIQHCLASPQLSLPTSHIFVITGHSSIDWLQQTKDRFPLSIHPRIFHRNNLDLFVNAVSGLNNLLIIIDEVHIAAGFTQTIRSAFESAGLFNYDDLYSRDVKMAHFTATPDAIASFKLMPCSRTLFMDPPPLYTSIFNLAEQGRVYQYKDLCGFNRATRVVNPAVLDNIREITPFLSNVPKYHIIRTHHALLHFITINNFKKVFADSCRYISETAISSLDALLDTPPLIHTFIFIKEKLRCAKTIPKLHLGVLYDRFSHSVSQSAIIQGLAGRITGYHDNRDAVLFTNIQVIQDFQLLWDSRFEFANHKKPFWAYN